MKGQDWDNLVEFVREHAENRKLAEEALGIVSAIPPTKQQQIDNLWWADPHLGEPTWAALVAATGLPIKSLRFVSLRETMRKIGFRGRPTQQSIDTALNFLDRQVNDSTMSLAIGLHLDGSPDIVTRLGYPAADDFIESMYEAFSKSHQVVDSVVYYYLGLAVTGQSEKVYLLKNLVALITRLLPLGQMREDPDSWLVMVA